MLTSSELCREIGGIIAILCKSGIVVVVVIIINIIVVFIIIIVVALIFVIIIIVGKDRTSMGVTIDNAKYLVEDLGCCC